MKRVIFLDIDDTLLDFSLSAQQAMQTGFEEFSLPFSAQAWESFNRINNTLWQMLERGELTAEGLFARRWNDIFSVLGLTADGKAFERRFLALLHTTAIPVEGAQSLCAYLAQRYTLCAASNAFHDQQINRLSIAGLMPYFSHVFVSETLGYRKPQKEFFDACLAHLGHVQAEDCVMIGDSPTADIAGGRAAGMQTILFDRSGSAAADAADAVVHSLAEITALL